MIRCLWGLCCLALAVTLGGTSDVRAERDPLTGRQMQNVGVYSSKHTPRRVVDFDGDYRPGTIIVRTAESRLYYVLGEGKAIRYAVGVGREGFKFDGTFNLSRKAEWPDWRPPAEMRRRQPYLPEFMAGGPTNPLGARALYVGSTLYRIHGTNEQWSIGREMSSGCIRMTNDDVIDLYERAEVGAQIVVYQ